jgi:hypothetical protein
MNMFFHSKGIKIKEKNHTILDYFWDWYWNSWIDRLYQYSWLYDLRWKITHWWRKDHWVKTNLPCNYHDKTSLMEDALFSLVDNYVAKDQEDAFSRVDYDNELIDVKEKIIKILHFYHVRQPELQKKCDDLLHICFGPVEMNFIDCEDKPEYKELKMVYKGDMTDEEREKKIREMRDLENQIHEETQEMLKVCVDVRPYLWT